jgi:hypothetical protein
MQTGWRISADEVCSSRDSLLVGAGSPREVYFTSPDDPSVPSGVVVAEGVWWLEHYSESRAVKTLTSQRLTDREAESTYYENTIDF